MADDENASIVTNPKSFDEEDTPADPAINQQVYLWFTVIVLIIGFGGNILVLVAFGLYKKLRSLGSIFIVNTAASDICVGVLGDLFIVVGIATGGDYLVNNENLCVLSSYFCAAVCIVSVWSIAAAAFNGYVRVCHHQVYSKIYTPVSVGIMVVAIWAAGILILLPTLFGWGGHYYDPVLMFCIPSNTASMSYTYFFVFTGWICPLIVIVYSFARIIMTVRTSSQNLKKDKKGAKGISKGEMAVIRSVMVIAVYFFAAYGFLLIVLLMGDNYGGGPASIVFAVVLAHTHCSFTGILYAATNKRYRESYKKMFRFFYRRGKVGIASTSKTSTSSGSTRTSGIDGAVASVTKA